MSIFEDCDHYDEADEAAAQAAMTARELDIHILATVQVVGVWAQTVQDVQHAWRLLKGTEIEWSRVTMVGRPTDARITWSITLPPETDVRDRATRRLAVWNGHTGIVETTDSFDDRMGR